METTSIVLNEDNYVAWSDQVKSNLDAQNLWSIVESRSEPPNQKDNQVGFAEWKETNMKALQRIWHSLGNKTVLEIYHIHSAHIAWSTLHQKYGMTDVINNLNKDNYLNWSNIVKSELRNQDLLNIVEPTPSPLEEEDSEVTLRDWRERNFRALRVIWNSSGHEAFHKISMLDSAYIAWITLKNKYGMPSNSDIGGNTNLNNNSFMERVHQIKYELQHRGLWNIIELTSEPPRQEGDKAAFEQWRSDNFEALRVIWCSCEWKEFSAIEAMQSAKLAWEYLVTTFGGPHRIEIVRDFLKAMQCGEWDVIEEFLRHHPGLLNAKVTPQCETALHVAVREGHVHIVENLVELMSEKSLEVQNISSFTALDEAIRCGNYQMTECMVRKNNKLTSIDASGNIPLTWAIIYGHEKLGRYLYSITPKEILMRGEPMHGAIVLKNAIYTSMWDIALDLIQHHRFLAFALDREMTSPVLALANIPLKFPSRKELPFWRRWICSEPKHLYEEKSVYLRYCKILCHICKEIPNLNAEQRIRGRVIDAIFLAIKQGNFEFLYMIVRNNPDIVWSRDGDGGTIFMAAVRYRQPKIFSLIYRLSEKNSMLASRDNKGNTLLHVAAMLPLSSGPKHLANEALKMQREIQWFKEVESICPESYKRLQNDEDKTATKVFRESHENLSKEGVKWIKSMANYCSVMSFFIIYITAAAMFTVPGGNNQDTGLPIFFRKQWFRVFVMLDMLSFMFATTSIVLFLAIQASGISGIDIFRKRYAVMAAGTLCLFFSLVTMTAALWTAVTLMNRGPFVALPSASVVFSLFSLRKFLPFVRMQKSFRAPRIFHKKMERWF